MEIPRLGEADKRIRGYCDFIAQGWLTGHSFILVEDRRVLRCTGVSRCTGSVVTTLAAMKMSEIRTGQSDNSRLYKTWYNTLAAQQIVTCARKIAKSYY